MGTNSLNTINKYQKPFQMKFCQFLYFTNKTSNRKKELFLPTPKPSTKLLATLS